MALEQPTVVCRRTCTSFGMDAMVLLRILERGCARYSE